MILNLSFSNFYSFGEETEVSFEVGKKPEKTYYDVNLQVGERDFRVNKVVAVLGANGSGKTQFIKVISFLSWFISEAHRDLKSHDEIAFFPHMNSVQTPSAFCIEFLLDNIVYKYDLKMTREKVITEVLSSKTERNFSYLFKRELVGDTYHYKTKKPFDVLKKYVKEVPKNVSLLSLAKLYQVKDAIRIVDFFEKTISNINVLGRYSFTEEKLYEAVDFIYHHEEFQELINMLLCDWDFGLSDISYQQNTEMNQIVAMGIHKDKGHQFALPFMFESNGTQSALILLRMILPVLAIGGTAVIDELDSDLHPHLIPAIIDLFKFSDTNPHNAQLIFSCHSAEVLNELQKHQVYLTEKLSLKSEAWRLDYIDGLRHDDNFYAKYLSGALGGIPKL